MVNSTVEEVQAEVINPPAEIVVKPINVSIDASFAALEAYVDEQIKMFAGTKIDPENEAEISAGRKVCAELNNLKKPIEAKRKEVKVEYEKPLKQFEADVKKITSKIDVAREQIDMQVKEADRLFRERRHNHLREYYQAIAGDMTEIIALEAIEDSKWLTRMSLTKAENELSEKAAQAVGDRETLKGLNLPFWREADMLYCHTLDLQAAINRNSCLVEEQKRVKEHDEKAFLLAQEAAKRAAEAAKQTPSVPEKASKAPAKPEISTYKLMLECTKEEATSVAQFAQHKGLNAISLTKVVKHD